VLLLPPLIISLEELLIDFREILGEHSGENLGKILWDTILSYGLAVLQLFVSRDCRPDVRSRGMACAALRVATRLLRARRDSYG
jgi:hypothetical protein